MNKIQLSSEIKSLIRDLEESSSINDAQELLRIFKNSTEKWSKYFTGIPYPSGGINVALKKAKKYKRQSLIEENFLYATNLMKNDLESLILRIDSNEIKSITDNH